MPSNHGGLTTIHRVANWVVADAAALAALVPVSGDDHKVAYQVDTDQVFVLSDWSGPTWVEIGGSGDMSGPGSSTDNALVRFDGATGKIVQSSGATLDDSDVLTMAGNLLMVDNQIVRPNILDYGVENHDNGSVSGTATINMENGNSQYITLTGNITTFSITNPPASGVEGTVKLYIEQGGTGSYTITWGSILWPGAVAPTLATAVGAKDILVFSTVDGGTTWFGFIGGLDMG
jgi:hypothetical protein